MKRHLRAVLPAWLAARAVVGLALVATAVVHAGTEPSRPLVGTRKYGGLLSWDAAWYLDIARRGYDALPHEGLRFFPLFPVLARFLGALTGGPGTALVLMANAFALGYAAVLHRVVAEELGDDVADRTGWVVAVAPIAFVLVMGYTEALAGLLAVIAVHGARRGRWGWAAAAGAVGGALRPSGLLVVVPLAVEAARALRAPGDSRWRPLLAVAAPGLGTLPYLAWVQARYGDGLSPYRIQNEWYLRGPFANPVTTVVRALGHLDGRDLVLGLRGLWALGLVALVAVAARRLPASYTAYGAVSVAAAVSTASLGSLERYAYGAFPVLVAAATLLSAERVRRAALAISAAALGLYALLTFLDLYVP